MALGRVDLDAELGQTSQPRREGHERVVVGGGIPEGDDASPHRRRVLGPGVVARVAARHEQWLATQPAAELDELTHIYVERGLEPALARQVAQQLTANDALKAHARDELGIVEEMAARPLQAAFASASAFAGGAVLPILTAALSPTANLTVVVAAVSLVCLALLGGLAGKAGGASIALGAGRVAFWGALAMVVTAAVGRLFGTTV